MQPDVWRVRRSLLWVATLLWLAAVVAGAVILALAEPARTPLVAAGSWVTNAVFLENVQPAPGDVSEELRTHPEARFFRSWPPGAVATLRTAPFTAPEYIAIPYSGYPAERGMGVWLECLGNGRRLAVARGNAHEIWVERTLHLPAGWCRSSVQLVASSASPTALHWVAIGTPFATSRLAWLKESVFVQVVVHALALWLLLGTGLLVVAWRRPGHALDPVIIATTTLAIGYLQFFVVFYLPGMAVVAVAAHGLAAAAGWWLAGRGIAAGRWPAATVQPLAIVCLLSLAYVGLLYGGDVGAGTHDATYRFDPAIWSTDNQLGQMVAEALYQNRKLVGLLGAWHVSDRPPLLTGVFLLGRPLWNVIVDRPDNLRLLFYFYQVTGIVASTLWVLPVWVLIGRAGLTARQRMFVIGLLATVGAMLFNSVYIWPKMIAGVLTLAGCLVLPGLAGGAGASVAWLALYAGTLMGLGLMSHSGVVFTVPFAVLLFMPFRRAAWIRNSVLIGLAAGLMVVPWTYWQRAEDPPGNALTKAAVAGTYGFDEPDLGVLETARRAYGNLTFAQWWDARVLGFTTLAGLRDDSPDVSWLYGRERDAAGTRRLDDFIEFGRSLRLLNVGWLVLAWVWFTRGGKTPAPATTRRLATESAGWCAAGVLGLALNVLLLFSIHITHTQSYLSLLLVPAGLATALVVAPATVRWLTVTAHVAYFVVIWVWTPLAGRPVAAGPLAACGLASLLLLYLGVSARDRSLTGVSTDRVEDGGRGADQAAPV